MFGGWRWRDGGQEHVLWHIQLKLMSHTLFSRFFFLFTLKLVNVRAFPPWPQYVILWDPSLMYSCSLRAWCLGRILCGTFEIINASRHMIKIRRSCRLERVWLVQFYFLLCSNLLLWGIAFSLSCYKSHNHGKLTKLCLSSCFKPFCLYMLIKNISMGTLNTLFPFISLRPT